MNRDGKRPRSDKPSQHKSKKRLIINILPWETRIRSPKKILKELTMLLRGLDVLFVGSNT